MYYLQSRYYDSQIGRFVNADDVSLAGVTGTALGYNLFAYCENNPVRNIDVAGYLAEDYSGFKWTKRGFNVNVKLSFLSRPFCLKYAKDIIKEYCNKHKKKYRWYSTLDGMSATRIAQELWFHAPVYYIGSPIKAVLSRYGISWSKLNSWITSASYMEINSNDDRAWAFAIAWFAASGIQRTLWGTSSTSVLCYIVI